MDRVGPGECSVYEEEKKTTVQECYHSICFNPNEPHCAQNKKGDYQDFSTSCELNYEQCIHPEQNWKDRFSGKCEDYFKSLNPVTV